MSPDRRPPPAVPPHGEEERDPTWSPELGEALNRLLYAAETDAAELDAELQRLEAVHGDAVYSRLIYLLSHLSFAEREAKRHWRRIVEHRASMRRRLGSEVDPRVALISYFVEVDRKFENPTIIEMRLFERTRELAYLDELTGLRNHRFFAESLAQEVLRSDQYNVPVSLVMMDLDDFKQYNDLHGHEGGNQALAAVGEILGAAVRQVDVAARYGGEEFALILHSTPKTGARLVAERVRSAVERHASGLTVSAGVATYPADAKDDSELVRQADRAMYVAKAGGKNQVQLFGHNRRSFRRVEALLEGRYCLYTGEYHDLRTVNVSQGGLRFRTDSPVPADALLDIRLALPGNDQEIPFAGRVVQSKPLADGGCEVAIRTIDIATRDVRELARYVRRTAAGAADPRSRPAVGDAPTGDRTR